MKKFYYNYMVDGAQVAIEKESLGDVVCELGHLIDVEHYDDLCSIVVDSECVWTSLDCSLEIWLGEHTKRCPKCGRLLLRGDFHKSKKSADGLQSYCKKCSAETNKMHYHQASSIDRVDTTVHDGHTLTKVHRHEGLARFTPRQLLEELKARGYRWDYMLEPQRKVMFEKI